MRKYFLNRALIVALLITTSITIYASNSNTNIPPTNAGFGIGLTGLYLQPGASNLEYATYTQPLPAPAPHWQAQNVKPSFHPAFILDFQYTFKSRVDQLRLSWLYLNTSDSDSASASGSASVAPPYYFGPLAQALFHTSASGNTKFNVNSVNLIFDHIFNINHYLQLTPFLGIAYAHLKQSLEANYQGTNAAIGGDPYNITAYNISTYNGAGPRLGLNAVAYVAHHFGILVGLGTSIIVGSMNSNTSFLSQGRDNPTAVNTSLADQTLTRIVPEIDSKLGLTYQFTFHSGSSLGIQAGYMFMIYFNGANQVVPTALVPDQINNGVIAVETSGQVQTNFDLNGPYLRVAWQFG